MIDPGIYSFIVHSNYYVAYKHSDYAGGLVHSSFLIERTLNSLMFTFDACNTSLHHNLWRKLLCHSFLIRTSWPLCWRNLQNRLALFESQSYEAVSNNPIGSRLCKNQQNTKECDKTETWLPIYHFRNSACRGARPTYLGIFIKCGRGYRT